MIDRENERFFQEGSVDDAVARRIGISVVAGLLLLSSLVLGPAAPARGELVVEAFMTDLDWPVAIALAPDGRVFYAERFTGNIRVIENGTLLAAPFYTFANRSAEVNRGLLGLALDPHFPASPFVYAYYTIRDSESGPPHNRIVRLLAAENNGTFDRVLVDEIGSGVYHNGGAIAFGPDGKLYAVTGDAEISRDAQDVRLAHGKTLRLNPDGSVPDDNPFGGNVSANPYVYTYGHRNSFGIALHPVTGKAYMTENGPECNDEINLLIPGGNYGWGSNAVCASPPDPPLNTNQDGTNPVMPMWWYSSPIAPTNAIVYGGSNLAGWQGDLIFGDFNTGSLRRLDLAAPDYDTVVSESVVIRVSEGVLDVEEGPDGAIWFTTQSTIYRLHYVPRPPVALFTVSAAVVNPREIVTFNASGSYDADGTVTRYAWDFGDGESATGAVADHAYDFPGRYTVRLEVSDDESYIGSTSYHVRVNYRPQAYFTSTPRENYIGVVLAFDAGASSDVDGRIVSFLWDFGDATLANGARVWHAYATKGAFTATLTVVDEFGATDRISRVVTIGNRAPQFASASPASGDVLLYPGQVETFAVAAFDPDGDPMSTTWRLNGAVAEGGATYFVFNASGPGLYLLNVTLGDGALSTSDEWTILVVERSAPGAIQSSDLMFVILLSAALVSSAFVRRRLRNTK